MTKQEAYERIRVYFTKPGAQLAQSEDASVCSYKTSDGRRCAVGCLMPDKLYNRRFENRNICELAQLPEAAPLFAYLGIAHGTRYVDNDLLVFLSDAQDAHDRASSVSDFIRTLDDKAYDQDLDTDRAIAACTPAHPED